MRQLHKNTINDSAILRSLLVIVLTAFISFSFILNAYPDAMTVALNTDSMDPEIKDLLDRVAHTKAIGVFTKLSIKSNVTRLHQS